jgi:hypothetical protein
MSRNSGNGNNSYESKIFDNSIATMVEEYPIYLIPVINEAFGTKYGKNDVVILCRDVHHRNSGVIITDILVEICGVKYHIECQSYEDGTMQIRMFEYDVAIAIEQARHDKNYMEINFPKSCVLQLRSNENTPDNLEVKLNFQDGSSAKYSVPVVKVNNYSCDDMFEKNLLLLIPFYMMRYEQDIKNNNSEQLPKLYDEMTHILQKLASQEKDETQLTLKKLVVEMFEKICYYLSRNNKTCEERMGEIMRDNPLNLEVVRILHQGRSEGKAEGKQEDIIELLEECGEVSDKLIDIIKNQTDMNVLKNWLKAAANVESVEEFEKQIITKEELVLDK